MRVIWRLLASLVAVLALLLTACGGDDDSAAQEAPAPEEGESGAASGAGGGAGSIDVDGSSTVGPLTDAIAEEYAALQPDTAVNVGVSGTGGGFERFCAGETDISNASRAIEEDEIGICEEAGIDYVEVRVGTDALTMATHPETEGIECLTTEEVVRIWSEEDAVNNWSEVNPEFPDEEIQIFAPGVDSGTYDFFNETVLGDPEEGAPEPRQDYNASEDDNIIAQGIEGTPYAWGYFGFAYYQGAGDRLQPIAYDAGEGCTEPSVETAESGEYGLSRPLYIYVSAQSLQQRNVVADFVTFYLDTVNDVIQDVGYIPAPAAALDEARSTVEAAIAGESPSSTSSETGGSSEASS